MVLIVCIDRGLCACGKPATVAIYAGDTGPIAFCDPHAKQAIAYAHTGVHVN